jgi:hypothetical protein
MKNSITHEKYHHMQILQKWPEMFGSLQTGAMPVLHSGKKTPENSNCSQEGGWLSVHGMNT